MNTHMLINIFHIFIVVPFLLYVAISKADTNEYVYYALFATGLFVFIVHGYKSYIKFLAGSSSIWINLLHLFYVSPLLLYIGYKAKETLRPAYEMLALLTFAALGYHTYSLIVLTNLVDLK